MQRPPTDWLLLPVFLLPPAALALAAVLASTMFDARLATYRSAGADAARSWAAREPDGAAWVAARFAEAVPRPGADEPGWTPYRRGASSGLVRTAGTRPGDEPWVLAEAFPAGLTAAALGDPAVRVEIEAGGAVARHPGADAATAAFGSLLGAGDGTSLRAAPLPAATKLWIARRRISADIVPGSSPVEWRADRRPETWTELMQVPILEALCALERALDDAGGRLPPGAHLLGRGVALVPPGDGSTLLYPDASAAPTIGPFPLGTDDTGAVRLLWSLPTPSGSAVADGEPLWSGTLATPLAGTWTIVRAADAAWWRSGDVGRWLAPVAFGTLAFLLVPAALLVSMRRRRRLDEARARFVTELAHDLRTPVAALRLHAELLAEGRTPEAERGRHAEIVAREAARLSSLLANLLDLARLERGARTFDRAEIDVGDVVEEAVGEFALLYPKRSGDVSVACAEGLVIDADRTALARSLANLLDNAGKFTTPGTAIRVRAERIEGASHAAVRIVVEDDGPGVAPADRARLFRLYERGSAAATNAAPGTGLGLALVRELVQGMGGRVTLRDTPRGASFEIVLGADA